MMEPKRKRELALISGLALISASLALAAPEQGPNRRAGQEALKAFGTLVGPWKGVGQPQRSSGKGAWTEKLEWVWKLSADSAALEVKIDSGKYLKSAVLSPGKSAGVFSLEATLADDSKRTYTGKAGPRDQLVLTSEQPGTEGLRRITISPLHETRFLMLLEGQDAGNESFFRLAEVGYTRQGVAFAAGDSYPVCIVTDGRGTIEVKYKGQSYWVCCSGCKDLFQENPAAVIADAAERRKEKEKEKAK
jgi:YHS domain-containing protein